MQINESQQILYFIIVLVLIFQLIENVNLIKNKPNQREFSVLSMS